MFQNGFGFTKVFQWWARGIPDDAERFPPSSHNPLPWEKLGVLWTSLNNYQVHTQSKEYRGSALRNHHEKSEGSCALSPWSLAGAAIFNYISFPVCNFWLDWFDVRLYEYSQGSTGSPFFQLHQYFLWYCEWRRGKIIDSGSRDIEGDEPGNWYRMQVHKLLDVTDNFTRDCAAAESHIVLEENSNGRI